MSWGDNVLEQESKMETKVWYPSLTSQFLVCPVPFHFDTYRGCQYNCAYCFARDFVTFSRRKSEHKESTYLIGNTPASFMKWMNRVDKENEHNYNKGEEVAIKERIPMKIGATADPFPYIEAKERITHDILSTLDLFNYPTEIQTKNPEILASYCDEFKDANWTIAVTLISTDEEFIKVCEPNAPSAQSRLDAIKKLTDKGFKVMVKIQPAIYPKILVDLPLLIKKVAEAGCWAVNIEGLKIRISMPKEEQKLFQTIGDYLKIDLRDLYRTKGEKAGSDREMRKELKQFYVDEAISHCKEQKIKCFIADNHMGKIGDGCECCGTEVLKDYKIWGCNSRTRGFGQATNESQELGKCVVNFTRSYDSKKPVTMNQVAKDYLLNKEVKVEVPEPTDVSMIDAHYPGEPREYFGVSPTLSTACGGSHLPYIKRTPKQKTHEGEDIKSEAGASGGAIRRLTPVEYERLQGFPDDFTKFGINSKGHKIKISDTQRYKCLGNAVSVPVVKEVAMRLLPYLLDKQGDK